MGVACVNPLHKKISRTGKVVTEGKEVKEIWQQYTEELYRRDPNATDSFNENIYEDEPEVMEIEVKEALRQHI